MLPIRTLLAALLLAGLAACAGGMPPVTSGSLPTPEANAGTAITVNRVQDGKFLSFVGPRTQHDPLFLGVPGTNYDGLRTLLDTRTGETASQLFVEDSYAGAKRDWSEAQDEKGQKLRFIPIRSDEITCDNGCSYAEEFAAALPEPLLRASTKGLMVTFVAKSGAHTVIQVPGPQVAAQLAAVDNAKKSLAAQAAAPGPAAPPPPPAK
ncbi:MAG TPA: hypothetical protein VHW66_01170 [Stellaceae bacterium]|nr:hypothetical protein [Stellaceae bacterium]